MEFIVGSAAAAGEVLFVARAEHAVGQTGRIERDGGAGGEDKDVGRTLTLVRAEGVAIRAHHHGVAAERDRVAELIIGSAVAGGELPVLRPYSLARAGAGEDVGRTLTRIRADVVAISAHYQQVAAERDGPAEVITNRAVVGVEFLLLRPERGAAGEDVGRTLTQHRTEVAKHSAHHQRVAAERDGVAEEITSRAVAGGEFLLERPTCPAARENAGRALIRCQADVVVRNAHDHGVAAQRDRSAEGVRRLAVVVGELRLQRPDLIAAVVAEDVGRTLIPFHTDVVIRRAHHHGVTAERDCVAEVIIGRAVEGGEFLLLRPACAAAAEEVDRTLIHVQSRADDVVIRRAHHQRVAAERDGVAEVITPRAVVGGQFLLQRPDRPAADEDVDRALIRIRAVVVFRRAHHQGVAAQRDGMTEVITAHAVRGQQLLLFDGPALAQHKGVGRALRRGRDPAQISAHQHRVAVQRHRVTEAVIRRAEFRAEVPLRFPIAALPAKHVG